MDLEAPQNCGTKVKCGCKNKNKYRYFLLFTKVHMIYITTLPEASRCSNLTLFLSIMQQSINGSPVKLS